MAHFKTIALWSVARSIENIDKIAMMNYIIWIWIIFVSALGMGMGIGMGFYVLDRGNQSYFDHYDIASSTKITQSAFHNALRMDE